MLQAPIAELDIAPGNVVEWTLRPYNRPDRGGSGASYNQEKHFSVAVDAQDDDEPLSSYVACTFELDGPPDRAALHAALDSFVRRHEVLRCEFEPGDGALECRPMGVGDVVLEPVEFGRFDDRDRLRAHLEERFRGIDTLSWPLLVMGAVERAGSTTVYLAFDHMVSDGLSTPIAVNDVASAYAEAVAGRADRRAPVGSYLEFSAAQRAEHTTLTADDPRFGYWKGFMRRNGGFFPPFPLDLGVEPGGMYATVNSSDVLLDAAGADAFEAQCRKADGKTFMGVLAAVGTALRREGGPDVYRGLMPVGDRGRGSYAEAMGWFVNTMPIEFPVAPGAPFAETMAAVRAGAEEMRDNLGVPFVQAWRLLAPEYADLRSWPYAVNFFSYIDFRKTPGADRHAELRARKHVWSSHSNGICFWFHRADSGLHVNTIAADTPQARATKVGLMAAVRTAMESVASRGEL
ncbi:condensation domain-containing protein [Nocardiopsis coralliicola]